MDDYGLKQTRSLRKVRGDGNQLKETSGYSVAGRKEENQRFGLGVSTPDTRPGMVAGCSCTHPAPVSVHVWLYPSETGAPEPAGGLNGCMPP